MPYLNYIISLLPSLVLSVPIVLFSLSLHELSHGYVAYRLGDPTAKREGRLSLNPLRHLDPIGAISMVLFRFGWAKPVPVDCRYFKNPKRGMALVALAGPVANLLLAIFFGAFSAGIETVYPILSTVLNPLFSYLFSLLYQFGFIAHTMNLYLAVFNLIPIPPLDGSRILFAFLPDRYYFKVMRYERAIQMVLLLLIYFGFADGFLSSLVSPISNGIMDFFLFLFQKIMYLLI